MPAFFFSCWLFSKSMYNCILPLEDQFVDKLTLELAFWRLPCLQLALGVNLENFATQCSLCCSFGANSRSMVVDCRWKCKAIELAMLKLDAWLRHPAQKAILVKKQVCICIVSIHISMCVFVFAFVFVFVQGSYWPAELWDFYPPDQKRRQLCLQCKHAEQLIILHSFSSVLVCYFYIY